MHADRLDEHSLSESISNKSECTPGHHCYWRHDKDHKHGTGCGHEAIPHGKHIDYLVDHHLHHPCEGHCDHHGAVSLA